jgi:hypothetical protein
VNHDILREDESMRAPARLLLFISCFAIPVSVFAANDAAIDASKYYVAGDGKTDDTAALQRALDECGKQGGGVVRLATGTYVIRGHLTIPDSVTLEGVSAAPTAWTEGKGTTLQAYEGRGSEDGVPFILLKANATLRGVTIHYPEQTGETITPYPWCLAGDGGDNVTILDCLLVNPYQGIDLATRASGRHFVARVYGCPIRRGISVDKCYDVGRIENVHFWPFWAGLGKYKAAADFVQTQGEAFIFGRTDWQYVLNTFCWGYRAGYRFIKTKDGVCNGNFLGIGADACNVAVQVDDCSPIGLLITNGEFVAFPGENPTELVAGLDSEGVIQLANCAFWGPSRQCARIEGKGFVSFNQCNFLKWDKSEAGVPCIEALSGRVLVNACRFNRASPAVHLGSEVRAAVVTSNMFASDGAVTFDSGAQVEIANNVVIPRRAGGAPAGSKIVGIDDPLIVKTGDWLRFDDAGTFAGAGFWSPKGDGTSTFRWNLPPDSAGERTLSVWLPEDPNADHAREAKYEVHQAQGVTEVVVDQHGKEKQWVPLGRFTLDANSYVMLTNRAADNVVADALAVIPVAK